MKKIIILIFLLLASFAFYKSCVSHKIDEKIILNKNGIELKLVTYFENLPLHFTGNVHRVECKSRHTKFKRIPTSSKLLNLGISSDIIPNINILADKAKKGYHVMDNDVLIIDSASTLFFSWNGCLSFSSWSLEHISNTELVESTPEYEQCLLVTKKNMNWPHVQARIKKLGTIENSCKIHKFLGDNSPRYSNFQAAKNGTASVLIHSGAFKNTNSFFVKFKEFGKSWDIKNYSK